MKKIVMIFGRFNPPTTGHELLVDKSFNLAKKLGAEHAIFTSKTNDPKKNPLSINDKIKFMKLSFPKHKNHIYHPDVIGIKTPADVLEWLSENGYEELHFMVGSDRVKSFEGMINSMQKKGYTKFKRVVVVSAGERDPDADDVSGMSASKMRGFVEKGDFDSFAKGTPMNSKDAKGMFDKLKKGMEMNEQNQITEKLKPSDPIEKWIRDFIDSDDPRFKDKTKEERIEMAKGAYYGAQKEDVNLEQETLEIMEVLSKSARRRMSIRMKQQSAKLANKRELAMKKTASKDVLEKRARKMAVNALKKKLLKGKDPNQLSMAEREKLEQMIKDKSAIVDKLTKKFFKIAKEKEMERKQSDKGE